MKIDEYITNLKKIYQFFIQHIENEEGSDDDYDNHISCLSEQNINENQRKRFRDEMLSFFGNKDISRSPVNPNFKLFPTDPQQLGKLSEYAQLFANYQFNPKTEEEEENENETDKKIPFSSVRTIIQQSIAAIASSHLIDESTKLLLTFVFSVHESHSSLD